MPLPPGELRRMQDEERRRARAHRRLRWARRRRIAIWLLGGAGLLALLVLGARMAGLA